MDDSSNTGPDEAGALAALAGDIRRWAEELGLSALGIATIDLAPHDTHFRAWLAAGHHGEMDWMARHGEARWRPDALLPGTVRVIADSDRPFKGNLLLKSLVTRKCGGGRSGVAGLNPQDLNFAHEFTSRQIVEPDVGVSQIGALDRGDRKQNSFNFLLK